MHNYLSAGFGVLQPATDSKFVDIQGVSLLIFHRSLLARHPNQLEINCAKGLVNMSKEIVLDIETQSAILSDLKELKISVIGCYFYETDSYESFEEQNFPVLWKRLEQADRLIGFNTKGFDFPVMNNYYSGNFLDFPNLDILEEIHKVLGFRLKLDDVAAATVGVRKSGHGLQAVEWWKQGEIQKIKDYCLQDVKVTKAVYEYGLKYQALAFTDRQGSRKAIPIDFAQKPVIFPKINLTMGF